MHHVHFINIYVVTDAGVAAFKGTGGNGVFE